MTTRPTYCNKELCLALEKKGIDAQHIRKFEKGGSWYNAYTLDVVCKWLREAHNLFIDVCIYRDSSEDADGYTVEEWTFWSFDIYSTCSGHLIFDFDMEQYDTYEKAQEAAIRYCVENLI